MTAAMPQREGSSQTQSRGRWNSNQVNRKNRRRSFLDEYKMERGCGCGYKSHPRALTFHHRDAADKSFEIGNGNTPLLCSWEKLLTELDKCDVICFNCHMVLHVSS